MKPRAFTLIELLIVVAIVAVLVGLLLPALARSRDAARLAACVSNQKQICASAQIYADACGVLPLGEDFMSGAQWATLPENPCELPASMFTCPSQARFDQSAFFDYFAGELLAGIERPGQHAAGVRQVTRHYETFPEEWLWVESIRVHDGKCVATRMDGSHVLDTTLHADDAPFSASQPAR